MQLMYMLNGALAMACLACALFFLRFWRQSKDRLFAFFALSFLLLATNAVAATMLDASDERRSFIYVVRLFAFLLIIYAIWDKNRSAGRGS
jgi:O-antigen/teichoic acid export membrane protein